MKISRRESYLLNFLQHKSSVKGEIDDI